MDIRGILTPVLAAALASAPRAAQAAERTSASFEKGEQLAGSPWIPRVVALAMAIAIVVVVADGDDDPVSP